MKETEGKCIKKMWKFMLLGNTAETVQTNICYSRDEAVFAWTSTATFPT